MSLILVLLFLGSMYGSYRAKDLIETYRGRRKKKHARLRSPNDIVADLRVELADDLAAIKLKKSELKNWLAAIKLSNDAAGGVDRQIDQLEEGESERNQQLGLEGLPSATAAPADTETDDEIIIIDIETRRRAAPDT